VSTARGKIQRRSVTGDSSLFDIPPPKFGRYSVQQQLGVGATGAVFRAEDSDTHRLVAIKALRTHLSPEVNHQVADDLVALIDRLPAHPSIVRLRAAGFQDREPYLVSDLMPGEGLDDALNRYGPGAIGDLLPRVRALAEALDQAAAHDLCHGALHPSDVIISEASTSITGIGVAPILAKWGAGIPIRRPYTAPEIEQGEAPTLASDQYSLAALTFEWLFGEVISSPATAPLDVPELPDADSDELSEAFTIALAREPSERFINCRAFVDALTAAVPAVVSQPSAERFMDIPLPSEPEPLSVWDDEEILEAPLVRDGNVESEVKVRDGSAESEVKVRYGNAESELNLGPSFLTTSMPATEQRENGGFGLGALAATLLLGMGLGLVGGYFATTTMLSTPSPAAQPRESSSPATSGLQPTGKPAPESKSGTEVPVPPPPTVTAPTATAAAPAEAEKKAPPGRLQIRSTPAGASVQVDGVTRGVTPLTLSGLELGPLAVSLSRDGYVGQERRVTLSRARPSQSVDVQLARARTAAATTQPATTQPAPTAPAAARPPTAGALGGLIIESRPPGAAVTVNGVPRGTTPISIGRLPPGSYTVTMRLAKYQPVSMVVTVTSGERARAAATLTLVE
jgi:serine/threonine protein kinase